MLNVEQRYRYLYKPGVFIACLAPAVWLTTGLFGLFGRDLGPDPVAHLLHSCGKTALNLIMITLLVTPVRQLTGWTHLLRLRRMLGLFAFSYVVLHFLVYVILDQELNLHGVIKDIAKRPYITIGFTALLLLIPLAVTSTNRMMRRLGRRWQSLHRLVYVVAILGVWHYYWQVKRDVREPLLYALALTLLLGYRLIKRRRTRAPVAAQPRAGPTLRPSESD
jgi:sulfoxide reductase heme-binding subunit YedZ